MMRIFVTFAKKVINELQSTLDISDLDISNSAKLEASPELKKYILIAFYNHNLALETFLQVQIT